VAKPGKPNHDALYRLLFGDPRVVAQLLRDFVGSPWIDGLDLDQMTRLNTTLHSLMGQRRESDLIWRIPRQDGGEAYVVLLLEIQSTSHRWMALRVLVYTALLWQHLEREQLLPQGRLPPVMPIVLYNGDARWTSPVAVQDLIALPNDVPLWHWQPQMRYLVIDEGAYAAKDLEARDSLVALLFRLEKSPDPEQVVAIADAAIAWFSGHPGYHTARTILANMLGTAMASLGPDIRVPENLLELRNMLATRLEKWAQDIEQRGRQEGEQIGRQVGEAALLLRLLERRFGVLPAMARERVLSADTALLEHWALRVLDAGRLDDVLTERSA
jgi:hypothetical protein